MAKKITHKLPNKAEKITLIGHYIVEELVGFFFLLLGYLTAWLLIFLLMFAFAWQECDKIMQSYDSHRTNTDCKLYNVILACCL